MAKGKFSGARQKHAALVLATAGPKGLAELLELVGGERRALERSLESLEEQGLVEGIGTGQAPARGQPSRLWALTPAGRAALPLSEAAIGRLEEGRRWIWAAFSAEQAITIDGGLEDGGLISAAEWVTRFDGDGRGYFFVFHPATGPQPVESLYRALTALGARCSMGTAGAAQDTLTFLDVLRTAAKAAKRALEAGES